LTKQEEEIWRPISDYEERYWVSTHGRIKSFYGPSKSGRQLKTFLDDGTLRLYLSLRASKENLCVRDLVLETFIGPRPTGYVVRHLDGDRANCRLDNLFSGPRATTLPIGDVDVETRIAPFTQLTAEDARAIAASGDRAQALADRYGVTKTMVESIRHGRTWRQETEGYRQTSYRRRTNAKLTEVDVRAILESRDESIDLAEQYGVTRSTITQIRAGTAWREVARPDAEDTAKPLRLNPAAKITPLETREIAASTERAVDLAARYGIAKQTVDAIRQGRLWEAVTRDVRRQKCPERR
jgi:DNA-binding Xre family transcriptional regulator